MIRQHAALAVLICLLCSAFGRGAVESYAVFLPVLREAFGWAQVQATSVYAVLQLGIALGAIPIGRIYDRWGPRRTFAAGFLTLGVGMVLASQATTYWQFCVAVGLMGGIGAVALGPVPSTALIARWYGANLTTSIGAVWAASGFGVLLLAPATQLLIDAVGWKTAYLAFGILLLVIPSLLAPLPWSRIARGRGAAPTITPGARRGALRRVLRERAFWALCGAYFFTSLGMFSVHPQIVAMLRDAGFSELTAATAFGLAGMVNFGGMLLVSLAADRSTRLVVVAGSYGLSVLGIVTLLPLLATAAVWLLWVFVIAFGGTMGARGPVLTATGASVFGHTGAVGTVVGAILAFGGVGSALGTAMGGLLRDLGGTYSWPVIFAVCVLMIPPVLFCLVPELRTGRAAARRGRG